MSSEFIPLYQPGSRTTATVPNFTPAAGSYLLPNTPTVTSIFVLQGDTTGGGTWATIATDQYVLFPVSGTIAQRLVDDSGNGVDWSTTVYPTAAFRIHAYTKSVGGLRTSYTDQTVTFADDSTGYSPIGQVGELNGEALTNAITPLLVAGGGNVIADDYGVRVDNPSGSVGTGLILSQLGDANNGDSYLYYTAAGHGTLHLYAADVSTHYDFEFDSTGAITANTIILSGSLPGLTISSTNVQPIAITYTGASGSAFTNAPRYATVEDDGAAMASGDLLGGLVFFGAEDNAHTTTGAGAAVYGKTTQAWTSSAHGASLVLYTVPNGSLSLTAALTLGQDQSATFAGNLSITDAKNIILGTTTGTTFGTGTTQKIGFYGAGALAQQNTGVTGATRVGGGGTTITTTDTFAGYTLAQIVAAFRNLGFVA